MRPFLKWAGNKYRLVSRIHAVLPGGKRLIEPFAGSAALFLNSDYPRYLIADANGDLIALFSHVQREGEPFIDYCRSFFTPAANTADVYYQRRQQFNTSEDERLKSALFVYFNGLCRYNQRGVFNVPFGRYARPYFPQAELEYFHHKAQRARFVHSSFDIIMDWAEPGDVIYCDPPYVPLSATAHFTSYSAHKFGMTQQLLLAHKADELAARGIPVVISNHHTDFTRHAYRNATLETFDVRRQISCDGGNRNMVSELLAVFG